MGEVVIPTVPEVEGGATPAFDLFSPLVETLFGYSVAGALSGVLGFLAMLWTFYAVLAYIVCIILLLIFVYASTNYEQLDQLLDHQIDERERIWDEQYRSGPRNDRFADIQEHIASDRPNDWKLAIIEADIMLDELLKQRGYRGASLGERLKSIRPSQLESIEDAWQAHKVRNQIAHGGADFVLTKRLAEDTIKQYRRVFAEFGIR